MPARLQSGPIGYGTARFPASPRPSTPNRGVATPTSTASWAQPTSSWSAQQVPSWAQSQPPPGAPPQIPSWTPPPRTSAGGTAPTPASLSWVPPQQSSAPNPSSIGFGQAMAPSPGPTSSFQAAQAMPPTPGPTSSFQMPPTPGPTSSFQDDWRKLQDLLQDRRGSGPTTSASLAQAMLPPTGTASPGHYPPKPHRQSQGPGAAAPSVPGVQAPSPRAAYRQVSTPSAVSQGVSGHGPVHRRSLIPAPMRSGPARTRTLYFNDRQTLPHKENRSLPATAPADVAGGHKTLEFALQVLLNVQALDPEFLARAMLSPKDGIGGLDAMTLMQRLHELGPKLVTSEERLQKAVQSLSQEDTVYLLQDIGLDDEGIDDTFKSHTKLATIHDDIFQVLKQALPADTLADAISAIAERRLHKFLEHRGVTRYSNHIVSLRHDDESWASVWQRLWLEYPSRPLPKPLGQGCEHRADIRIIIIGPGFGLLATPHMIDLVRAAGYQILELPGLPNLENTHDPAQIHAAVQSLQYQIESFQPHVICAASKGGLYFNYLWRDPNWSIPCVLINAHPNIAKLPNNAPVVVTQGSRDDTFKRITERATILLENEHMRDAIAANTKYCALRVAGDSPALVVQQSLQVPCFGANGSLQMSVVPAGAVLKADVAMFGSSLNDPSQMGFCHLTSMDDLANLKVPASISYRHGREDLEDLARTGAPTKTFLYLSTSGLSVRPGKAPAMTRAGDGHAAPESLCKDDCLPRLIDAAASGRPEDSLHESWLVRTPQERRAGESFLGYDPEACMRLWTGGDNIGELGCRVPVSPDSDEFFAIEQIFRSNPADKNYNFGHDWEGKQILRIDRVQARGQLQAIDAYYLSVQKTLESQGTRFVNGVHTRWLFHGSRAIDSIVSDPLNGFKVTLSKTTMWGSGSYFARDAQYPDDHGFCGEPRPDGSKDVLLCLVVTGMSALGDEAYAIKPYRHGTQYRYNSLVDTMSNPEIFVVNTSDAVLPAYVISYA